MPFMFCSLPLTLNRQAFVSYVGTVWSVLFHCCLSSNSQNLSHSFSNGKVWREPSPSPPRPGGGYPFSPTKRTRNTSCCTFIVVLGGRQGSISASNVQTLIDTKVVFFFPLSQQIQETLPDSCVLSSKPVIFPSAFSASRGQATLRCPGNIHLHFSLPFSFFIIISS